MKKIVIIAMLMVCMGCSDAPPTTPSFIDLEVSETSAITAKRVQGKIGVRGQVNRYRVNLTDAGRILQIKCSNNTLRSDVVLLVNVFEKDAHGKLTMIAGSHATNEGKFGADIKINIFIDRPKELYIHVRDLLDDDFSDHPYYLSANYEAPPDGNGTFASAVDLAVDGDAQRESIGSVGDIDCFGFTATTNGVYDVLVDYSPMPGTGVRLCLNLFTENGTLIETRTPGETKTSHMVHYLEAGNYKVVVYDEGKDDFDTSSIYDISVALKTDIAEINTNDVPANASEPSAEAFDGASIDYYQDADWYGITISETADINIMELSFQSDMSMNYMLEVYKIHTDSLAGFDFNTTSPLYSHMYRGGTAAPPYTAVLKLDIPDAGENYYYVVRPQAGSDVSGNNPYTASVTMDAITDEDERGHGNDLDVYAIDITALPGLGNADGHEGKIAYRGDVDWFKVIIPLSVSDRIFSVYLDTPDTEQVDYAMDIIRDNRDGEDVSLSTSERVMNTSSPHKKVDLKTGFVVKGQETGPEGYTDATYYIKVYDLQNDDGENAMYRIKWNIEAIPNALPALPGTVIAPVYYNDEKNERIALHADYDSDPVRIEYADGSAGSFKTNNQVLDMSTATSETDGNGTITITFPWAGGYIDYQGDEDWYSLDLSQPFVDTQEDWYYTINVETYANNSAVEYVWEYHPDSNNDRRVHVNRCSGTARHCSGVQAAGGDTDIAVSEHHATFPSGDDAVLWLGSLEGTYSWKGAVFFRFYDFNFRYLDSGGINDMPDDDWGYDAPYYFRVTLTFHQGSEKP